jgi:fucose permease
MGSRTRPAETTAETRSAALLPAVLVSFAAFVLVGINSGAGGVLLPAQMSSYHVDQATIGIMFFTGSAGFALAGLATGSLLHRLGIRHTLALAAVIYVAAELCQAVRPPFEVFLAAQLVCGFGLGILESVLNVYLAGLPGATSLLNRLHAFWGVGALIGPPLAAALLGPISWTGVYVVLAVAFGFLAVTFLLVHPRRGAPAAAAQDPGPLKDKSKNSLSGEGVPSPPSPTGLLGLALKDRGVLLGSVMLTVYVGLEIGVGNWAYTYLTQGRGLAGPLAGYLVSAYWAGLTLGRFVIPPAAVRFRVPVGRMVFACLTGITAATVVAWLAPTPVACAGLALLGFSLAPIFPTTMSIVPRLTGEPLVPTAIGVMNSASTIGGSVLPWFAGFLMQNIGMNSLLPYALVLGLAQFAVWRPIASVVRRPALAPSEAGATP